MLFSQEHGNAAVDILIRLFFKPTFLNDDILDCMFAKKIIVFSAAKTSYGEFKGPISYLPITIMRLLQTITNINSEWESEGL